MCACGCTHASGSMWRLEDDCRRPALVPGLLGTKLRLSGLLAGTLTHTAILPAPKVPFLELFPSCVSNTSLFCFDGLSLIPGTHVKEPAITQKAQSGWLIEAVRQLAGSRQPCRNKMALPEQVKRRTDSQKWFSLLCVCIHIHTHTNF